mmetsp:Transcript_24560/g.37877  ORF Transcript_24560/g.37877 Transcript_24560/m.37877 type:complete len:81 (+) Transcript_24560:1150-1392(+)
MHHQHQQTRVRMGYIVIMRIQGKKLSIILTDTKSLSARIKKEGPLAQGEISVPSSTRVDHTKVPVESKGGSQRIYQTLGA